MKSSLSLNGLVLVLSFALLTASYAQVQCKDKAGKTVMTNVMNNYAAPSDDCDSSNALFASPASTKKVRLARVVEEPIKEERSRELVRRSRAATTPREEVALETRAAPSSPLKPVALSEFKVAPELQKKRDLGRQQLLALELALEQKKLAEIKTLIPQRPKVEHDSLLVLAHRHLNNIASLKRELGIANTPR